MKHLFLTAALSLGMFAASAQEIPAPQTTAPVAGSSIAAGNWMMGGSIGSTGFNFSTNTFSLNVNPMAAYFVDNNVAVGATVILGLSAYDGGHTFNYGIAPLVRYYFPEGATPSSRWFAEGNAGISGSSYKDSEEDQPVSLLLGIKGGYSHFVASHVALEATLGYTYNKADINSSTGVSGLGIGLGFQIYLPGSRNRTIDLNP